MVRKKVGVLGSGAVGKTLAAGFASKGYPTMIGTRNTEKLKDWLDDNRDINAGTFDQVAAHGEVIVVALKGTAANEVVSNLEPKYFEGKTVIDATNPIEDAPPVNGVLSFFTGQNESLMERLQESAPRANFVKCFNSVPGVVMINPDFEDGRPTMFICGNHGGAKVEVRNILDQFGWDVEDLGAVEAARAVENLAMLACIKGITTGNWSFAFKLVS